MKIAFNNILKILLLKYFIFNDSLNIQKTFLF